MNATNVVRIDERLLKKVGRVICFWIMMIERGRTLKNSMSSKKSKKQTKKE